ncbi:MAG: CinA family protein [Atopobiaceae bacterium]|jgi:nicotinamide-nucleotide amidase
MNDSFDELQETADSAIPLNSTSLGEKILELATALVHEAAAANLTLSSAESCTGGLVSGAVTAIPGSSAPWRGSVVSYAIPVKHSVLGVSNDILDAPGIGAVSSECAAAMCEGAKKVLGSDIAVSITGIAGPGGAEPGKPVGTVWFGITSGEGTHTEMHMFTGDRRSVREQAVACALGLMLSRVRAK